MGAVAVRVVADGLAGKGVEPSCLVVVEGVGDGGGQVAAGSGPVGDPV